MLNVIVYYKKYAFHALGALDYIKKTSGTKVTFHERYFTIIITIYTKQKYFLSTPRTTLVLRFKKFKNDIENREGRGFT